MLAVVRISKIFADAQLILWSWSGLAYGFHFDHHGPCHQQSQSYVFCSICLLFQFEGKNLQKNQKRRLNSCHNSIVSLGSLGISIPCVTGGVEIMLRARSQNHGDAPAIVAGWISCGKANKMHHDRDCIQSTMQWSCNLLMSFLHSKKRRWRLKIGHHALTPWGYPDEKIPFTNNLDWYGADLGSGHKKRILTHNYLQNGASSSGLPNGYQICWESSPLLPRHM